MRRARVFGLALALVAGVQGGCAPELPPEAYGSFQELNDPAFRVRLDMGEKSVAYFVSTRLRPASPTITCRGDLTGRIRAMMRLTLTCNGESIPFSFEFREASREWIVREDESAPRIFSRQ